MPAGLVAQAGGDTWRTAIALRDRCREFILRHCGEPDLAGEELIGALVVGPGLPQVGFERSLMQEQIKSLQPEF